MRRVLVVFVVLGLLLVACGGGVPPADQSSFLASGETIESLNYLPVQAPPPGAMPIIKTDQVEGGKVDWYREITSESEPLAVLASGALVAVSDTPAPGPMDVVGVLMIGTGLWTIIMASPPVQAMLNSPIYVQPHFELVEGVGGLWQALPQIQSADWSMKSPIYVGPAPIEKLADEIAASLTTEASDAEIWAAVQGRVSGSSSPMVQELGLPEIEAEAFPGLRAPTPVGALLPPFEEGGGGGDHAAESRKSKIIAMIGYLALRYHGDELYYSPRGGRILVVANDPVAGVVAGIFYGTVDLATGGAHLEGIVTVIFQYHNSKAGVVNVDQLRRSGCHSWQLYPPPPSYTAMYEPVSAGGAGTCELNGNAK